MVDATNVASDTCSQIYRKASALGSCISGSPSKITSQSCSSELPSPGQEKRISARISGIFVLSHQAYLRNKSQIGSQFCQHHLQAFYYLRVIENPSCRWSQRMCAAAGVNCEVPMTIGKGYEPCCSAQHRPIIQERAWSSPIWYTPPQD